MNFFEKVNNYKIKHSSDSNELNALLIKTVGFTNIVDKLGLKLTKTSENEYVGFCPDHFLFTGRYPSHPKWFVNEITGATYCMTEGRGSNLLETAKRLMKLPNVNEAFDRLTDNSVITSFFTPLPANREIQPDKSNERKLEEAIKYAEPFFDRGAISQDCLAFFGKDDIRKETLCKYGVCSCSYGKYKDRALIPFLSSKYELSGFVAIDLLGKEEWAKRVTKYIISTDNNADENEIYETSLKRYKKVMYSPGFQGRHHLYGMYENLNFASEIPEYVVLVEGERDCLKLLQEGVPCLSIHGTFLKDEQKILMKTIGLFRNIKNIYLGFDMDEPGRNACKKVSEVLSSEIDSNKIRVLEFPNGKDPKKFNRNELIEIINNSKPAF